MTDVLALSSDLVTNYERFIAEAETNGGVWALKTEDGWAMCQSVESEKDTVLLFWSNRSHAADLCVDEWKDHVPTQIDFEEFCDLWLPGMDSDRMLVGLNFTADLEGIEATAEEVMDDFEAA